MRLSGFLTCAVVALALATQGVALAQPSQGLPPAIASAGVTQAQWSQIQAEVRRQAQRAGVTEAALAAAAEAGGGNFARSGRFNALALQQAIFEELADQADQIAELQARLQTLTGDADPAIAACFAQARAAIDAGRLAEADRLLADISERDLAAMREADAEVERRRLRAVETIASRGQVAYVQASYRTAASHYARAAETAPESARERRWQFRSWQALALLQQGWRFETAALTEARDVFEASALPLAPRSVDPRNWANTQVNLGNVLNSLGERQAGADGLATLAAARQAYERALEVRTRATGAQSWALTQTNLGLVLTSLGERQAGTEGLATLADARQAFERALEVRTRATDAQGWAVTQTSLGNVFLALGQLQAGAEGLATLAAARAAYESALEVRTRATDPQGWAVTQANFGIVLRTLGERQAGAEGLATLAAARQAHERALEVLTRATDAQRWAQTQANLGNLLRTFGERQAGEEGLATLAAARKAFEMALELRTRATDPQGWAVTRNNLGMLELTIGDRGGGRAAYQRAIGHYRAALEVFTEGEYRRLVLENIAIAEAYAAAAR